MPRGALLRAIGRARVPAIGFVNERKLQPDGAVDPRRVALLQAWLDAGLETLVGRLRERGYRFITLREALEDPAYASADTYVGPAGITWLHRWALTQGRRGALFAGEPEVPEWIRRAAQPPR